jgi:hypothetical protein
MMPVGLAIHDVRHRCGFTRMPPLPLLRRKLHPIQRDGDRLPLAFLADNLDAVGRTIAGGHIDHELFAHAPPTGLLAAPLDATTGPGQGFPIEQATTWPNHPIGKMTTGALDDVAILQRMQLGIPVNAEDWHKDWHDGSRLGIDRKIHGGLAV